ncbi:hypothetical protein [Streptacidiphilus melanogenes]|uniref:hypothetical protein n=1 Tax=Streptacidiphilus melanogenes TaxID=411235 RepID=UPI0005A7DB42|nr:hypothetical protein [Streptacidiphilus melanogenes]
MHQQLTPLHAVALYTLLGVAGLWTLMGVRAVWLAAFRPWAVGVSGVGIDPDEQVALSRAERRAFVAIANELNRAKANAFPV